MLRLDLPGARYPSLVPDRRLPGIVNYLIGNDPRKWHTRIPTYARVTYRGVYPRIDLVFHGARERLEYDWLVHPGGDPRLVMVAQYPIRPPTHGQRTLVLQHQPGATMELQVKRKDGGKVDTVKATLTAVPDDLPEGLPLPSSVEKALEKPTVPEGAKPNTGEKPIDAGMPGLEGTPSVSAPEPASTSKPSA